MNRKAAADRPPIWTLAPGGARLPAPTRFAGGRRIPTAWNRTGRNPALQMPRIDLLRSMPRQRRDENLRRNPRNPRRRDRRRGRLSLSHGAGIPGIPAARPAGGYPLPRKHPAGVRLSDAARSALDDGRLLIVPHLTRKFAAPRKPTPKGETTLWPPSPRRGNRCSPSTWTKTGTCATVALARFKSTRSADAFPNERRRSPHFATCGEYMPCRGFRVAEGRESLAPPGRYRVRPPRGGDGAIVLSGLGRGGGVCPLARLRSPFIILYRCSFCQVGAVFLAPLGTCAARINAEMMGAMGKPDRAYPWGLAEQDANSGASRASLRACPWHPSIEL
jgi:hypothetical protein